MHPEKIQASPNFHPHHKKVITALPGNHYKSNSAMRNWATKVCQNKFEYAPNMIMSNHCE